MQSKGSPVRIVYIVDDDAALLGSLERTFRAVGLTAVSYQTAFAFLDAAPDLSDGCLLLDIIMPEMDGLELQERLNSLGFNMPVIVMTARGDVETAVKAMKSGAVDFIEKPFNDEALLDAINAALALARGPTRDRESVVAAKRMAKLSPRERQVLDGLVAGRSTKQMAYDLGISARTVEVHRARMLARLGTHSLAEAIRLAVLAGLPPADLEANAADRQRRSGASRGLPE
ncbi:MAG TPA: response regulator [Xanthobacteraceae bacterium]|nr:response regulator [Xanthobacteraceae bacterium]